MGLTNFRYDGEQKGTKILTGNFLPMGEMCTPSFGLDGYKIGMDSIIY
jgi:hypothetical protein